MTKKKKSPTLQEYQYIMNDKYTIVTMHGTLTYNDLGEEIVDDICTCGHKQWEHPKFECSADGCNCMALQL